MSNATISSMTSATMPAAASAASLEAPVLRIALLQLAVTDGAVATNLARAERMLRALSPSATDATPDLVLLPELWTTGYVHDVWAHVADTETPRVAQRLAELSAELGVAIGGTMITRRDDSTLVNRFTITTPDGAAPVVYDKSHLFAPMREPEFLTAGSSRVQTVVRRVRPAEPAAMGFTPMRSTPAALSICYDLRFPAMYRASAHDGAELFLVASAWPDPRGGALRTLATARAVENQAFLVLCNRAGAAADGTTFCGGSMVVAPSGELLLDLGREEGVGVAELPIQDVATVRSALHVLQDERAGVDR